ncbi:response regulator [Vibrio sp. 10N.222.54.A1]|uniref:response regulator n=1 Tax=unclassified Vibrio TaxID=2614977 RepID=UPI000C8605FF|nr:MULTISPECIES: response regulator [unclassified Vibrio]PMK77674.1 two-component system response regulator BaeR [Vibrio sp. 10N.261.52.E5]TKF85235.1 response regulator [Vibrio sp. F13]
MTKPQVLIVEDEAHIAEVLVAYCQNSGFEATHLASGSNVINHIRTHHVDMMLLDLMLPDTDGMDICKQVRAFSQLPIIMITAKSEEIDRLLGLEFGADDYICKPFSPREVIARIKTVLRRVTPINSANQQASMIIDSGFEMKPDEFEVRFEGALIDLTPQEFKILKLFLENTGRVFSRDDILNRAYSDTADVSDRNIDTHIKNIRKKVGQVSTGESPIRSVYGVGYKFTQRI